MDHNGELAIFKNAFTMTLVSWIAYLWIDAAAFALFWVLLFFDYVTGMAVAIKKKNFVKREAVEGIIWKALLLIIPLSLWILWKIYWYEPTQILAFVFWSLAIAEVYSIFWNIYEYRTGKVYTEVDLISLVIQKSLSILRSMLEQIISKPKAYDKQWKQVKDWQDK